MAVGAGTFVAKPLKSPWHVTRLHSRHDPYKTRITPSKKSVQRHQAHLKQMIRVSRSATQTELIEQLTPIIRGWCQYYRSQASSTTFAKLSSDLFAQLLAWAKRRHPNLNAHQIVSRYWLVNQGGGWQFQSKDGVRLQLHRQYRFYQHIKVKGNRSPYDGDWVYWGTRLRHYPGLSPLKSFLLREQDGKCRHCGLYFRPTDTIEMHHQDGQHHNNQRHNLALLHRHCHDQAHPAEILSTPGTRDLSPVREEPDELRGSSPVLKPSRGGDSLA